MLLMVARVAPAQLTTATITGMVSDQTGGALPGADVTIKNVDTGISQSTISNESGRYEAPNLPLGN